MRKKTIKSAKYFILPLFLALVIFLGGASAFAAGELAKVIDKSNCAQFKDLLIPALYRAVERGDFVLQTGSLSFDYGLGSKFMEASKKNAGKFDVTAEGDLIDKTGKIPYYNIYGWPFPKIDPKDPKAAIKMMYNFQWSKYRLMGYRYLNRIVWIDSKRGEHRYLLQDGRQLYLSGRPPAQELAEKDNPNHIIRAELGLQLEPFDMYGTNQMTYEYMDERDVSSFAYVPSIRRVRQSSGVVRSDPYFGSDAWNDLGMLWDGKNRWMDWKLVGEKTILVAFSTLEKRVAKEADDGTFFLEYPQIKYGYQVPRWKGATWAPVSAIWVPRKVWVIEQMPKDPYYAWGLHINYVDQETYIIWMKEVNDKTGVFRTWALNLYSYSEGPSGRNNVGVRDAAITIDEKVRHATLGVLLNSKGDPEQNSIYQPSSRMSLKLFTKNALISKSK